MCRLGDDAAETDGALSFPSLAASSGTAGAGGVGSSHVDLGEKRKAAREINALAARVRFLLRFRKNQAYIALS